MKLGELLVRDNRITESQLIEAIDRQGQVGGRLGTIFVELNMIDIDTLTVYLGLELSIPIASGAALERAKKTAVRLLTPEQAAHYCVVPLILQDRQVIAAVDDPYDMQKFHELYQLTGYRIIPRVAPEIRVFYYLERYYGVPRPDRFRSFGDSPRAISAPARDLPSPPLPGLPPQAEEVVVAPNPAPPVRINKANDYLDDAYEALELGAEDLLEELEADGADAATAASAPAAVSTKRSEVEPARQDEEYEPVSLGDTMKVLTEATGRNEIAKALMGFARKKFDVAALCVIRDHMAMGWKGFGGIDNHRVETLLIPLDGSSMFRAAFNADDHSYIGPAFPSTLHNYLFRVLRCDPPDGVCVYAIAIGKRVVNLLYGHKDDGLSNDDQAELKEIIRAVAAAYVRIISANKPAEKKPGEDDKGRRVVIADADASPSLEDLAAARAAAQVAATRAGSEDDTGEVGPDGEDMN